MDVPGGIPPGVPHQILLVDSDGQEAAAIGKGFRAAGLDVDWARDTRTGLRRSRAVESALVVLDVALADGDGHAILRTIRDERIGTPVIVLSAQDTEFAKLYAFGLGADDYVVKPFAIDELVARVFAVLRRVRHEPPDAVVRVGDIVIDPAIRTVTRAGQPVSLSPRTFDLLLALWYHRGRVSTAADLYHEVWRQSADECEATVAAHVFKLRRALERDPRRPRLIVTVRGGGYLLTDL
jgi:DNA-binding response OmpR family regulator